MPNPLIFDDAPELYDRVRPRYVPELFAALLEYAKIAPGARALEIGCGTGQATRPFLEAGVIVEALEPGVKAVSFTENNLKHFKNLRVINEKFEDLSRPAEYYDLIYSATAFHWIDPKIALPKAFELLKRGGTLALFWNRPYVARRDEPTHLAIQSVYSRFFENGRETRLPPEQDQKRYDKILSEITAAGFSDPELRLFKATRVMNACDYVALLNTYSDHISLPPGKKQDFMRAISGAIEQNGSSVNIYDTMDLYLARKS